MRKILIFIISFIVCNGVFASVKDDYYIEISESPLILEIPEWLTDIQKGEIDNDALMAFIKDLVVPVISNSKGAKKICIYFSKPEDTTIYPNCEQVVVEAYKRHNLIGWGWNEPDSLIAENSTIKDGERVIKRDKAYINMIEDIPVFLIDETYAKSPSKFIRELPERLVPDSSIWKPIFPYVKDPDGMWVLTVYPDTIIVNDSWI